MSTVLAAGEYISWGAIQVSVTNLMIIVVMIVVFVLALLIPFPSDHAGQQVEPSQRDERREP